MAPGKHNIANTNLLQMKANFELRLTIWSQRDKHPRECWLETMLSTTLKVRSPFFPLTVQSENSVILFSDVMSPGEISLKA